MSRKRSFIVTLKLPSTVQPAEMVSYIKDAVASWKGQLKPESAKENDADWYDSLTDLDGDTVEVREVKK